MKQNLDKAQGTIKRQKVLKLEKPMLQDVSSDPLENIKSKTIAIPEGAELIFALDIGTRTVIGIVGYAIDEIFNVIAIEIVEHKQRAMLDGQIHDIEMVASVVKEVKEKMEAIINVKLTKVAIAAAGRALHTCRVTVERAIEFGKEIKKDLVGSLEMEAIQNAQIEIEKEIGENDLVEFYCVGYSVVNYFLNGFPISSLVGHKGKKISVDVLATFLPHIVVESLYTVMGMVDLEVTSLTLEPIAALNVTIPKDLRMLNLSIVDIGAGTSDIAITKDGSVVAYAMAPVAGDEISEAISRQFLTDFNTAEKIKLAYSQNKDIIPYTDILGKKFTTTSEEIQKAISEEVNLLGNTISEKILEYNIKAPNAVFLIGGGSQIPGLPEIIASALELPIDRVAVRNRDVIKNIKVKGKKLSGPDAITPIGIAVTAHLQKGHDFLSVKVNGKKVRLFNSKKLAVADALVLMGYNPNQLIGRSGKGINFELNGSRKLMRGEPGISSEITVDGKPASLDYILNPGSEINIIPASDGKNAFVKVSEFLAENRECKVILNGSQVDIGTRISANGQLVDEDYQIKDGDKIIIQNIITVGDLIEYLEINSHHHAIMINNLEKERDYVIMDGDIIEYKLRRDLEKRNISKDTLKPIQNAIEEKKLVSNSIHENKSTVEEIEKNENLICIVVNGDNIFMDGTKKHIFVDIFSYINFDLSKPQGTVVLKLNGNKAQFTDEIKHGDSIEIHWEKA